MDPQEIPQRVRDIIVEAIGCAPEEVIPTAHLFDDLGADSLDLVLMVQAFEEDLVTDMIDEADYDKWRTVQDVLDYIDQHPHGTKP